MINKENNTPATLAINATFGPAVKKVETVAKPVYG